MPLSRQQVSALFLAGAFLTCTGCVVHGEATTANPVQSEAQTDPIGSVTIDLPSQSLFSVIGFDYKGTDDARDAQQTFYGQALPMAADYGFARHATFTVTTVNAGTFQPQGFLMTSWPDQAAFDKFQRDPRWPDFDALRPEIWTDIRYYRDVQENGLQLTLKDNKFYTLAIAYFDDDNPGDYEKYLSSLEDEVAKNGGKFVLKLHAPKLESLSGEPSPDQLTFVEWDDPQGVDRVLNSETYQEKRHYAGSGTTKLAFYRLKLSL